MHKKYQLLIVLLLLNALPGQSKASTLKHEKSVAFPAQQNLENVLRLENNIIAVQVSTTIRNNYPKRDRIREKGLFNIGTADNKTLLYHFPDEPWSSHFNLKVDETIFSNDSCRTNTRRLPMLQEPYIAENSLICSWQANQIVVEQCLTPEQYSGTTGAVFIQYRIQNNADRQHSVGLLLLLDTMINENDSAAIATNFGYRAQEQAYSAPNVPDYFQAYEVDPVTPGLIAQGTLKGNEAIPPDFLVVGTWLNLVEVKWDYQPEAEIYKDSAVLLRWDEMPLQPGESRIPGTYYGLGEVTRASGELVLNMSAPAKLQYRANQLEPNPL